MTEKRPKVKQKTRKIRENNPLKVAHAIKTPKGAHQTGQKLVNLFKKQNKQSVRKILREVISDIAYHRNVWARQDYYAKKAGITLRQAHNILVLLDQAGLLEMENRGYKRTCLYRLGSLFRNTIIRNYLQPLFPQLAFILTLSLFAYDPHLIALSKKISYNNIKEKYTNKYFKTSVPKRTHELLNLTHFEEQLREYALRIAASGGTPPSQQLASPTTASLTQEPHKGEVCSQICPICDLF